MASLPVVTGLLFKGGVLAAIGGSKLDHGALAIGTHLWSLLPHLAILVGGTCD